MEAARRAAVEARQAVYGVRVAIEEAENGNSMGTTKVIRGLKVEERSASAKSTAEILRGVEESAKRTNEALALAKREARQSTITTTDATDPATKLDRMATERADKDGISYTEALSRVANEHAGLYAQHSEGATKVGARLYKAVTR
jgi:hypothetical protein